MRKIFSNFSEWGAGTVKCLKLECRNEECRHYPCGLCATGKPSVACHQNAVEAAEGQSRFLVDESGIGELILQGQIAGNLGPILDRFEAALGDKSLRGVFVGIDSFGGRLGTALRILHAILRARLLCPVWSYVDCSAFSAGLLVALSADRIFSAHYSSLGAFGYTIYLCDGLQPTMLVSAKTPQKWPADLIPISPPYTFLQAGQTLAGIQGELDSQCTAGIETIRSLRGDRVADSPLLDGRSFTAQEALNGGFIDEISDGPGVYQMLLKQVS